MGPVKLTPKQRRELRELKEGQEMARRMLEQSQRRAAEWRDARDCATAVWGVNPIVHGTRPKCKARTRRPPKPVEVQATETDAPEASATADTDNIADAVVASDDENAMDDDDNDSDAGSNAEKAPMDDESDGGKDLPDLGLPLSQRNLTGERRTSRRQEGFVNFDDFDVDEIYEQVYGRRRPGDRSDDSDSRSECSSSGEEEKDDDEAEKSCG